MERISFYVNKEEDDAVCIAKKVFESIKNSDIYKIDTDNPDIMIVFGGDGTLIHYLKSVNYSPASKYIGVNCGTLGFMQDFEVSKEDDFDADSFVNDIPNLVEKKVNFVLLKAARSNKQAMLFAINDIYIARSDDKALRMKVYIDEEFLEDYVGTGMIFSSQNGSTARNLSARGSIIFPGIDLIQMTPTESNPNNKLRSLDKSVCVPKTMKISLITGNESIKILCDGINRFNGPLSKIEISLSEKYITKLVPKGKSYTSKIRDKLI